MPRLSDVPGYVPGFLQPIENRILMIATGVRAQVGVKILGDNLEDNALLSFLLKSPSFQTASRRDVLVQPLSVSIFCWCGPCSLVAHEVA